MKSMSTPSGNELQSLRDRVAADPANLRLRFELGRALFRQQNYVAAMPELQKSMGDSQFRRQAGELLAEAFDAKGMPDLATAMRRLISGDPDDGSASIPIPVTPRPPRRPDASAAADIPRDEHNA